MTEPQKTLLTLLKASLRGETAEPGHDADWESVYAEARIQTVVALAARGLPAALPDDALRKKWKDAENAQLVKYIRYMYTQDELLRALSEASIPAVILKGSAAAAYYPQPSLRAMGDIDCLVSREQFDAALESLSRAGFTLDESHVSERQSGFRKNGFEVELHRRFSYDDMDLEDYIARGFRRPEQGSIDGHSFSMLPRLANGLVLLAHMRSHLKSGLGLRQVIDWMMYVQRELDDNFWNAEFRAAAREKHLDTLAIAATRLCQKYLGLTETITWCAGADDTLCDTLMDNLLTSGNFGRRNGSGQLVEKVATEIRRNGLFSYLQKAGEHNWKAYHRHSWLRPLAWLYQIFRYARQGLSARRDKQQLEGDLGRSRERYELLKKLDLT